MQINTFNGSDDQVMLSLSDGMHRPRLNKKYFKKEQNGFPLVIRNSGGGV